MKTTNSNIFKTLSLVLIAATTLLFFVLTGCVTVGPSYVEPDVAEAEAWNEEGEQLVEEGEDELERWWLVFDDPVLNQLIEAAYRQNLTLQAAGVRIAEARAELGIIKGGIWPQQQRLDAIYKYSSVSETAPNVNSTVMDTSYGEWGIGFNVGWELDVWGKYRRAIESGTANLEASIASYDDILVLLTAEVARSYVLFRTLEERIDVARENVQIQQRSLEITQAQFEGGIVTDLDVQQARSLLKSTEAFVPVLEAATARTRNSLAILLGVMPGTIDHVLDQSGPIPSAPAQVAVGVPADLMRRRPDIRLAERQLATQSARIGIAQSELYPQFALFGSIGLRSQDLGDLFSADSIEFFTGPALRWDILNYGRIRNRVRVQDARFQALLLEYENTVINAHREVEDALITFLKTQEQEQFLAQSVDSSLRAVDLSMLQYSEGLVDFQRVLDTQRFLAEQQDGYVSANGLVTISLIRMYKALGGGWEIRQGNNFINEDVRLEMSERTKWGNLLTQEELEPPVSE
jgi:NodT family efflux transporter outer membrane factor (OMF) lipoprotein